MAGYAPASLPSLSLVFDAPSNSVGSPATLPSLGLVLGATTTKTLSSAAGSFAMTGIAATPRAARICGTAAGSFSMTGNDATLTHNAVTGGISSPMFIPSMSLVMERAAGDKLFSAWPGSFALTGQTASPVHGYVLTGTVGSLIFNGAPADRDMQVTADRGSFSVTGVATAFTRSTQTLTAAAGSFAMTGVPAGFAYQTGTSKVLPAEFVTFAVTGNAATFPTTIARVLQCDKGTFAITVYPAIFTYVGWTRLDAATSTWTNVAASSTTWTAQ